MKFFILACLIAVASASFTPRTRGDLDGARRECIAELGVSEALVGEYRSKVFRAEGPTPCYLRCVFTRLGLFEEGKGFNAEYYVRQLGRGDGVTGDVRGCFDNSGDDSCMWAYRAFTCFGTKGLLPEGY